MVTPPACACALDPTIWRKIETWIFDLDNTLYPPHCDLWPKIDQKITTYISDLLGVDGLSARALQKYYYQAHGTTLNGLMLDHGIDPHFYLDFVHDIDRRNIEKDHRLSSAVAQLPGRKFVFTNGSKNHAEQTLAQLGMDTLFDAVFDIVDADFIPKPFSITYESFLARHNIHPQQAVMFEDIARNLEVPQRLGMRIVLVVPDQRGDHKEEWERFDEINPKLKIDAVTHDLAGFLESVIAVL